MDHNFTNYDETTRDGQPTQIPQYEIDALARAFLPAILAFYRSEEGQREFAEWKANRDKQNLQLNMKN
ncbi:MAG: hypothetical protein LBS99_03625 [Clostridiales bacterium]|jgi:hypothetical protein|nr:hypothetical protein [Clostridiales bacterium]